MIFIKLNEINISSIKDADYCCIIDGISKSNAVNLLQNADLPEKRNIIKIKNHKNFITIYKMSKEIII